MNIFVLDEDPIISAQYHCDKHVVKMITETAQILCSVYYFSEWNKTVPYKLSYPNHPCCVWARESLDNWNWLLLQGVGLYKEYRSRFSGKEHAAGNVLLWCYDNKPNLPSIGITSRPLCMPDDCKTFDVVQSYRNYYNKYKRKIFKWTNVDVPYWIEEE